jgi:hypothetical protein
MNFAPPVLEVIERLERNDPALTDIQISSPLVLKALENNNSTQVTHVDINLSRFSMSEISDFVSVLSLRDSRIRHLTVNNKSLSDDNKLQHFLEELKGITTTVRLESLRLQRIEICQECEASALRDFLVQNRTTVKVLEIGIGGDGVGSAKGFRDILMLNNLQTLYLTVSKNVNLERMREWSDCFPILSRDSTKVKELHFTGNSGNFTFFVQHMFPRMTCLKRLKLSPFHVNWVMHYFVQAMELHGQGLEELTVTMSTIRFASLAPAVTNLKALAIDATQSQQTEEDITEDFLAILRSSTQLSKLRIHHRCMPKRHLLQLCSLLSTHYTNLHTLDLIAYCPDVDEECYEAYFKILDSNPIVSSQVTFVRDDTVALHRAELKCLSNKIQPQRLLRDATPLALWPHMLSILGKRRRHPSMVFSLLQEKAGDLIPTTTPRINGHAVNYFAQTS